MLLAEELTLLALDDDSGHSLLGHEDLSRAIAMALTFELSLRRLTHLDPDGVIAAGPDVEGTDPLLDLARDHVRGLTPTAAVRHLADEQVAAALITRLAARGLIADDPHQPGIHPALDGRAEADVRGRLQDVLLRDTEPSAHDIALITLIDHVHLTATLFPTQDAARASARAHDISQHWNQMEAFRPAAATTGPGAGRGIGRSEAPGAEGGIGGATVAGAGVGLAGAAALTAVASAPEATAVAKERDWSRAAEIGVEALPLLDPVTGVASVLDQGGQAFGALVDAAKGMVEGIDFLELISLPFRIFE